MPGGDSFPGMISSSQGTVGGELLTVRPHTWKRLTQTPWALDLKIGCAF
jgi:hypothetical protein